MGNYFSSNLKFIREQKGISKSKLGDLVGVNQSTITRWENKEITPSIDNVEQVAGVLKVDLPDILIKDLRFDNAELIEDENVAYIPVLGVIKAGIPIEAQEDIIEYVDIPKKWLQGGKTFYGLKISGDSMYPKYLENDIVIFEKNEDMYQADNKDCAILINGFDATFKKLKLNQNGITLIPYNLDNTDGFETTYYDSEQIQKLPIKIIGIAKEKRTRL